MSLPDTIGSAEWKRWSFRRSGPHKTVAGTIALTLAAFGLSGCGSVVPRASSDAGSDAGSDIREADRSRPVSAPQIIAARPEYRSCLDTFARTGAEFEPIADRYDAPGCARLGTLKLSDLRGDRSSISVSNVGSIQCPLAQAFSAWARYGVDRAARQMLGSGVARIETMGSYSCRNIRGSNRRSAHARAAAIDVSAFVLQNGRRVSLMDDWADGTSEEREFLRIIHRSACKRFGTVLGPDYNSDHDDHFHLEKSDRDVCR